ncbi:hypothetical protein [Brevundimonas sp.]|uniref:hypothetical protein n=1 Tax=Brevundimonas sp. TaxID=1871086 RepID=UPI00261A693C|nr:hypothetical protein [Brevundimonas sp.]
MARTPTVPEEQRSFAGHDRTSVEDAGLVVRREVGTGVQTARPGDVHGNPGAQVQFGNLNRNLTAVRYVLERGGA